MSVVGGAASGAATGFAFGGPWGAIAGGTIGGITSMFSESSQARAMNENIRRAQALIAQGLTSSDDIADRLQSIDRQFNSRLTSVLNTTAIRSRGFANQGVIGAAAAGAVEGSRLATEAGVIEQSLTDNKGIRQAIAQIELGKKDPDMIGAFVEGAAAGATTGMEIQKMAGGRELPSLDTTDTGGGNIAGFGSIPAMKDAGTFNPFLKDQSPRAGNISDPLARMPSTGLQTQTDPRWQFLANVTGGFNG